MASNIRAQMSPQETLARLRDNGKFDEAVEYLRNAADDPATPAEFKDIVSLEIGDTLIEASRGERDIDRRTRLLEQAKDALDKFVVEHSAHPLKHSALGKVANLLVERARITIERSKWKRIRDDEKTAALTEAREMLDDAKSVFAQSRDDLKEKLSRITPLDPANPAHKKLIEIRDQYRSDYLQARLLIPAIEEEKADTYSDESDERKALLRAAADEFQEVYEDYRTRLAGLYARMYQGRCNAKLKQFGDALKILDDLLVQPDDPPAFKSLKQKVAVVAADCWLDPSQKKYSAAIRTIGGLLKNVNAVEAKQPDWLYLRLVLAKAYLGESEELKKTKDATPDIMDKIADVRERAKKEATIVAETNSEHRRAAQDVLAALGVIMGHDDETVAPTTFDDARLAGKLLMVKMQVADKARSDIEFQWSLEIDLEKKDALKAKLDAATGELAKHRATAQAAFKLALELADDDTPVEDTNVVRYFLCYLHYQQDEFEEAARLGEALAEKSPKAAIAQQSAKIAMAARLKLYQRTKSDAGPAEQAAARERLIKIAQLTVDHWRDSPDAKEAAIILRRLDGGADDKER